MPVPADGGIKPDEKVKVYQKYREQCLLTDV
jgi:hypothetical protein